MIDFSLMEASAHLTELKEILGKYKNINDYDIIDWKIKMEHIMAHLNKAYNIRNLTNEQLSNLSEEEVDNLSQTPNNLMYLIS